MADQHTQTGIILSTAFATFIAGYAFGIFTNRGYLISPELAEERRRNLHDPVESEEEDIDENTTILDHAPNWFNGDAADRRQGLRARGPNAPPGANASASSAQKAVDINSNEECKLVLVVRTDLGMTKGKLDAVFVHVETDSDSFYVIGKIAAQCSHATLACYKALSRHSDSKSPERRMLSRWEKYGQAKIAVQIKSQDEMMELRRKARSLGITAEIIQDAGRTQIEAGSITVLGVGPAPKSLVDQVTSHLKLL